MQIIKILFISIIAWSSLLDACSRVMYEGDNNRTITARSMDWASDVDSDLWIFPRGLERKGGIDENSIKWKSKYGSIVASAFNLMTSDGMNEKGLVVNLLYLAESDFGTSDKPTLSVGAWPQYVLDNFKNVNEVVKAFKNPSFQIIAPPLYGVIPASIHIAVSDSSGDSAILEYIKGKITIHHNKKYKVMTNSPTFDKQLALNSYWEEIGGIVMLPGTNRASDRFIRASYYTNSLNKGKNERESIATAFSIIRNVSVPLGYNNLNLKRPNLSTTRWRTVADHKSLKYYFESTTYPNIFWVDLKKIDFTKNRSIQKLELANYPLLAGEVSVKFIKVEKAFNWLSYKK